ncbi:MAG: serine/threonine protein kinase, partial [Chloroflexota bacterium]
GSPAYIAPEQAVSSAEATPASDLYSLGVMLFEMIAGQTPFSGNDPIGLAMQHINQPPPPPSRVRVGISPEVDRVVLKALAKRPEERYPSGQALYADLERALTGSPRYPPPLPTLAHLTIPERVRRQTQPLPPPSRPPAAPPPPPPPPPAPAWRPSPEPAWRPPPNTWAGEAAPPGGEPAPIVIPAPGAARSPWRTAAGVVLLMSILVGLLCLGGWLAMRGVTAAWGPAATRPTAAAALPTQPGLPATGPTPVVSTPTSPPTATAAPTAVLPAEPSPSPQGQTLVLERISQGHLLIINRGRQAINLAPLRLGEGSDAILGFRLGAERLGRDDCALVLNAVRRPKLPDELDCDLVIASQRRSESGFWMERFAVYYDNQLVGVCEKDEKTCQILIPGGQ